MCFVLRVDRLLKHSDGILFLMYSCDQIEVVLCAKF